VFLASVSGFPGVLGIDWVSNGARKVAVEKKKKRYHPTPPLLSLILFGVVLVYELTLAKVLSVPLNLSHFYVVQHESLQEQLRCTVS
jgi:hypothetical protein